jgi:hypothetical protein
MNVAVIKENIEETKMRKALKIIGNNALIDMAVALVNNDKRGEEAKWRVSTLD